MASENYYELHITFPPDINIIQFHEFCHTANVKPLVIYVPGALQSIQPMLSTKTTFSSDFDAISWGKEIELSSVLFETMRIKVESATLSGKALYWEAHWKSDSYRSGFMNSRNLITNQYYLTQRYEKEPNPRDYQALSLPVHFERVIYDSCLELDTGWTCL